MTEKRVLIKPRPDETEEEFTARVKAALLAATADDREPQDDPDR